MATSTSSTSAPSFGRSIHEPSGSEPLIKAAPPPFVPAKFPPVSLRQSSPHNKQPRSPPRAASPTSRLIQQACGAPVETSPTPAPKKAPPPVPDDDDVPIPAKAPPAELKVIAQTIASGRKAPPPQPSRPPTQQPPPAAQQDYDPLERPGRPRCGDLHSSHEHSQGTVTSKTTTRHATAGQSSPVNSTTPDATTWHTPPNAINVPTRAGSLHRAHVRRWRPCATKSYASRVATIHQHLPALPPIPPRKIHQFGHLPLPGVCRGRTLVHQHVNDGGDGIRAGLSPSGLPNDHLRPHYGRTEWLQTPAWSRTDLWMPLPSPGTDVLTLVTQSYIWSLMTGAISQAGHHNKENCYNVLRDFMTFAVHIRRFEQGLRLAYN